MNRLDTTSKKIDTRIDHDEKMLKGGRLLFAIFFPFFLLSPPPPPFRTTGWAHLGSNWNYMRSAASEFLGERLRLRNWDTGSSTLWLMYNVANYEVLLSENFSKGLARGFLRSEVDYCCCWSTFLSKKVGLLNFFINLGVQLKMKL